MALNDAKLRNLKPQERYYKAYDSDGHFVLVAPSGSRLWRLKSRFETKEKLLALGRYPEISLKDARSRRHMHKAYDDADWGVPSHLSAISTRNLLSPQFVRRRRGRW